MLTYFSTEIESRRLVGPLLLVTFCCGLLDVESYVNFGTFSSNQTGNTLILVTNLTGLGDGRADLALTGASLVSFLVAAFVFARLGLVGTARHKKRWWLLLSLLWQLITLALPAILQTADVLGFDKSTAWIFIALLGASSGSQVVMAKTSGNPEIPTAMLTTPFIDFLVDRKLFSPPAQPGTRSRDIRALYIASIVIGGLVGGGFYRAGGSIATLWVAVGLKIATMVWVALLPADESAV